MHPAGTIERLQLAETARADEIRQGQDVVVTYSFTDPDHAHSHEGVTRTTIARTLAAIKGCPFAGEYDPSARYPGRVYFVPSDTLVGIEAARALGVYTEDDLFGGVVPHSFVATKAITHPLVESGAEAPAGWSHGFAERVRDAVLPGFTVFTPRDARRAAVDLLAHGPVRLKPARGTGWRGQIVVTGPAELEAALSAVEAAELPCDGLVLEQNLRDVTTYSVGQVRVAGLLATYCGTERATTDNSGATVYGGSDLLVVRGDYDALLRFDLAPEVRLAVAQARVYDMATQEFSGLFASRRNYDVLRGLDAEGGWRSGVLEQSWRLGGASGPEVAALAAFRADPTLLAVHAWCVEVFGDGAEPPPQAIVHFRGVDDRVGPLTKYTLVEAYDRTR
ncbi:MAG TPA: DUF3182 family protein [Gemmataceae bacterium]|nr:DUF3182 family protein [Gemmataceae bacterium]